MPGNNQGSTSMDHERKARLRAAVEKAKAALQHSDEEEGATAPKAPEPPKKEDAAQAPSTPAPGSRLARLEEDKDAWRAQRAEDYAARYPGSPVPSDPVVNYRAMHGSAKNTTDEQIREELDTQAKAYDSIRANPDRYEEFLARRALPATSNVAEKKPEARKEFHDDASVVEAEDYERRASEYVAKEGVPGRVTGTKAEQLAQARDARIQAYESAEKDGKVATESGPRSRLSLLAERAAREMGPPAKAAGEMVGSSMVGAPTTAPTFESGSKVDRIKAAAKAAMRKFGGT